MLQDYESWLKTFYVFFQYVTLICHNDDRDLRKKTGGTMAACCIPAW